MVKHHEGSTRQTILTLIKKNGSLSVNDLVQKLSITEMAIRRHLNNLEKDGLVKATLVRQAIGRPTYVYALTDAADELFPKHYHTFALDVLDELAAESGDPSITWLFERRKNKMLLKYQPHMIGKSLRDRISTLAEIQNEDGYMVEWEQDDNGDFVLNEYNCPIALVAHQYPQACQCELELFQMLLGTSEINLTECMAKGGTKCTYHIVKQHVAKQQPVYV